MASASDILRVIAQMTYLGQQVLNVYHLFVGDNASDADLLTDIAAQLDAAYDPVNLYIDGSLNYDSIRVLNLTDESEVGEVDWPFLTGGEVGGSTGLPPGVAAVVTFNTYSLGSRGSKFIAGVSETYQTDGLWENALLTALGVFGDTISNGWIGAESGVPLTFGIPRPAGGFRIFSGYTVSNIPGYQRRRKQGVGS